MFIIDHIRKQFPFLSEKYIAYKLKYHSYVSLDHKYVYFSVNKAGCTTIKTQIRNWEKLPNLNPISLTIKEVRRDMAVHDRVQFGMPSLIDISEAEQEKIIKTDSYFCFTFIRNPYARVLSAWKDKARKCQPGFGELYLKLRGKLPDDTIPLISLEEFVNYLETLDLNCCNNHWIRQNIHIFYPTIPFSFIGKVEDLYKDLCTIADKICIPIQNIVHKNKSLICAAPGYTQNLADKVYSFYKDDFFLFNYDNNSWPKDEVFTKDLAINLENLEREIIERNIMLGFLYSERRK